MRLRTKSEALTVAVGDATVTARPLAASEISALTRKHTTVEWKRGRSVETFDAAGFARELFGKTVEGWEGVEGDDGAPLPCTAETKAAAWDLNSDWAAEVLEALDAARKAWREETEKNS